MEPQPETEANWLLPSRPQQALRVWGIDLGTTNSTVAEIVWNPDVPATVPQCRCLEIEQTTTDGVYTGPLVPSVLAILPSSEHWVGEGAKRLRTRPQEVALTFEKSLFYETKNDMGLRRSYHSVLTEWELGWLSTCLHMRDDATARAQVEEERARRKNAGNTDTSDRPFRPVVLDATSIVRREP